MTKMQTKCFLIVFGLVGSSCSAACRSSPSSPAMNVSTGTLPTSVPSASTQPGVVSTELVAGNPPAAKPAPSSDAAVRALCASGAAAARTWHTAPWKQQPNSIVALSFLPVPPTADPKAAQPQVCLVAGDEGKLALVARGPVLIGDTECGNLPAAPSDPPSFELDLAPYVLAAGSTALGVRLSCENTFGAGEGGQSRLYLLERQGERLVQVLDEEIGWFSHDRVASSYAEAKGVLVIQKRAHDGHFDLAIHLNVTRESEGGRALKQNETRKLVWQKDHYVRVGH